MAKGLKEVLIGGIGALFILALILGIDLSILLFPLSLGVLFALVIKGRGGALSGGISVSGLNGSEDNTIPVVSFDDVGGQEMAKREFLEALTFLKDNAKSTQLGIRPLKGVLLVGPPGTGKTLLAKAAANYTDSVFISASGSQFVQMYAGVGASRIRHLFKQARTMAEQEQKKNAIIFIDEIDVLGAKRGQNHSHMEYDQTLNELLTQIDGIKSDYAVKILVVGATNRADLLDGALLRPGRFDRVVQVELPDKQGRLHILKIHAKNKPLGQDVDLTKIAGETAGFSGAHLENLLNEGAINALRANRTTINSADLRDAIEKVMLGEKSGRSVQREELERVAYHEVGHALLSEYVKPGSVASITITPRSNALGYIRQTPQHDQYLYTKKQLEQAIQVCVAGTITEELIYGQRSTGAAGDIKQATELANKMVFSGLSSLGIVSADPPANVLHEAVVEIIKEQEQVVHAFLESRLSVIQQLAKKLLQEESMDGDELRAQLVAAV